MTYGTNNEFGIDYLRDNMKFQLEDMVQRTFLACLEAADRLSEIRSFRAYLLGVARHQLLRLFAERGRGQRHATLAENSIHDLAGPSQVVAQREEQRLLLAGLRKGDMLRMRWRDLDLDGAPPTLTIRGGKAERRVDVRISCGKRSGQSPVALA